MKLDHPPILAPGRHRIDQSQIADLFVKPFNCSKRAEILVAVLKLIGELESRLIPCEVWLDGSFVTEKQDPSDLDISIQIDADVIDAMDPANSDFLANVANDEERYLGLLDVFVHTHYPVGYRGVDDVQLMDAGGWAEQWMRTHGNEWLKGFAVIKVLETDVGLRLFS